MNTYIHTYIYAICLYDGRLYFEGKTQAQETNDNVNTLLCAKQVQKIKDSSTFISTLHTATYLFIREAEQIYCLLLQEQHKKYNIAVFQI